MRLIPDKIFDFLNVEEVDCVHFTSYLRLKNELRPDITFFYHHLREGMKLESWINEKYLDLSANGFLVCRLSMGKYSFAAQDVKALKFVITKIEKEKYLPVKMLEIKIIE